MAERSVRSSALWVRIAGVVSCIWVGSTYLYSLGRGVDSSENAFRFWNDRNFNSFEPENAFWFALVGVVLIASVCISVPWILTAARPRPFWTRIATIAAAVWAGGTFLNSLLHPNWLYEYDSDNVLWFGAVGALLMFVALYAIPWIIGDGKVHRDVVESTADATATAQGTAEQHGSEGRQSFWGLSAQVIAFILAGAIVRSFFIMQQPHQSYATQSASIQSPQFPLTPVMNGSANYDVANAFRPALAGTTTPRTGPGESASEAKPSFDCARVDKWAAMQVCANPTLADYDNHMNQLYAQLMSAQSASDKMNLRNAQREWIKQRDLCQFSVVPNACLMEVYSNRVTALMQLVLASTTPPSPSDAATDAKSPAAPLTPTPDQGVILQTQPPTTVSNGAQDPSMRATDDTGATGADCTKHDEEIAKVAKQNGYQYTGGCP